MAMKALPFDNQILFGYQLRSPGWVLKDLLVG